MPYRDGLHTMVNLLADYAVFEGHRVVIEIVNGTEISFAYDPPLKGAVAVAAASAEHHHLWGDRKAS